MIKKTVKVGLSLLIGGFFLWLAFKDVSIDELLTYSRQMSYGWLFPYFIVLFLSHYFRSERWLLLLEEKKNVHPSRTTLFTGVMVGYLVNYAIPRLGEISRCVYVSRKEEDTSSTTLLGTVVLERIIDLICLAIIMLIVAFYLVSDPQILSNIFGERMMNYIAGLYTIGSLLKILGVLAAAGVVFVLFIKLFQLLGKKYAIIRLFHQKFQHLYRTFFEGLLALRNVKNWWAFMGWTGLIWFGYILMVYIPFWMFDLQITYDLNLLDAVSIMAVASIGIVLPSPGGVGTYHFFVKQALLFLASVPAVTGLAFGIITHAVMMIIVFLITGVMLWFDRDETGDIFGLIRKSREKQI